MSDSYESIEHEGVVRSLGNNSVIVSISSESACSGCHASGSCHLSGVSEKIIEVKGEYNLSPGDNVTILMKRSMGYKAMFLGYLLPLIFFIFSIAIFSTMNISELGTGLGAICVPGVYYLILYFLRDRIRNKFTFTIKPL